MHSRELQLLRHKSPLPALASTFGLALFAYWMAMVLPLLGMGLGPAPGQEWLAFTNALLVPAIAASLLIYGGVSGLRQRSAKGVSAMSGGSLSYAVLLLVGCIAAFYTAAVLSAFL